MAFNYENCRTMQRDYSRLPCNEARKKRFRDLAILRLHAIESSYILAIETLPHFPRLSGIERVLKLCCCCC